MSANPTGPMNVVSARAGAVGATLVALLRAAGWDAAGEFYVNDSGNQVDLLGESLAARFADAGRRRARAAAGGLPGPVPAPTSRHELPVAEARARLRTAGDAAWFREQALERMLAVAAARPRGLRRRVRPLVPRVGAARHRRGAGATLSELESRGMTYRATRPEGVSDAARSRVKNEEGASAGTSEATWLRTHGFGDDMDRVVVRGDGRPTYLLPDIAYHRDKRARGFRRAINLWGPDHHAYVATLGAALRALGLEPDFLQILIVQQVNLLRDGQEVKMSKRAGEFVTLRELVDEVGPDCARFFFVMRSCSAHLDFDLGIALKRNDENPVFYVQYAHARSCATRRHGLERGLEPATGASGALTAPEEVALVRRLATFPEVVRGAAVMREPHRIPTYLIETAAEFHRFYHACRVVGDDAALSRHRLRLCAATQQVLRNGLALMGVSAPERLERETESTP